MQGFCLAAEAQKGQFSAAKTALLDAQRRASDAFRHANGAMLTADRS